MRLLSLVAAVVLAGTVAARPLAVAAEEVREVSAPLSHADGDVQPRASGAVGLRTGSDFDRFSVVVEGLDESSTVVILLGDGHENLVEIGTLASGSSRREFVRTTLEGGSLPLEAEHAADLSGRAIRITDGEGHAILVGHVPSLESSGGDEPHPLEPLTARSNFVRPENSPYDDSRGVIVVIQRDGSAALRIEVGHLAPLTHYAMWIGEGESASFVDDFTTNGEGGAGLVRDTAEGAELPGGADSLAALAGVHVEIRHESDVVLVGAIPHLEDEHDVEDVHEESDFDHEGTDAHLHVEIDIHPDDGHEHMEIVMHDLLQRTQEPRAAKSGRRSARAELYLDDGTGTMVAADSARIRRHGRARLRYDTRRGASLPLGVASLRELAGRAFEVRVRGVVVVDGSLPAF